MFWGLIMEPRRRYSQEVTRPFHVSMASLDISSCTDDPVQLMVMFQKRNYLLCTLQKGVAVQVSLDLNFESGDEVSFTINGASHIHLTGYHMEDDFEDMEDDEDEDEETVEEKIGEEVEEEEDEDAVLSQGNIIYGKRKQPRSSTNMTPAAKRSKTLELLGDTMGSDDDDSDDEDVSFSDLGDDDDDDEGETTLDSLDDECLEGEDDSEEDDEEEEDGEEEQEDEEESEEEFEKIIVQKQQTKKLKNKEKQEQQATNQKQQKTVEKPQKQKKEQQQITNAEGKKGQQQITKGEGKKGQQQQQQQQMDGTPLSEKKKKKNKQQEKNASPAKELNVSAKENKQEQVKTPKTDKKQQNQQNSGQKKFVDRGVTIEDISLGAGPPAKAGKFAHLYYEGRLKQNNKMFDSAVKGPPFKFRLGAAEVIKGWDVGVSGMKVGGKRRITVPPQMAYGSKGIPPEIPPNSTLIFQLELKNVT